MRSCITFVVQRQELQSQFDQFKARNEKLEEKCQQLLEIKEKDKQHVLPGKNIVRVIVYINT